MKTLANLTVIAGNILVLLGIICLCLAGLSILVNASTLNERDKITAESRAILIFIGVILIAVGGKIVEKASPYAQYAL